MHHLVAHAVPRTLLFRTWTEGRALWERVVTALPGLHALVLMPDHLHLLHAQDVRLPLGAALSGYVRWRNHRRGEHGPGVVPLPPAEPLVDEDKVRRSVRYVALNPCRARLVDDPLAWPLSAYRDALGLALDPVRRAVPDPHSLHAYVSADPTVNPNGTDLPLPRVDLPSPSLVADAVSALARVPLAALRRRGRPRALYLRAAKTLCDAPAAAIAAEAACGPVGIQRARAGLDDDVRLVARVAGDPRFAGLPDGDLLRQPAWYRYRR